jgi:3-methyladenine DNA glycosylase/8-oxoguanine DNA glycosylase
MSVADAVEIVEVDGPYSVRHALPGHGHSIDPTYARGPDWVGFAARTPDGPVSVRVRGSQGALTLEAWGPGAGWITARADAFAARHDDPRSLRFDDVRIDDLNRRNPGLRHAAHGCVADGLLARILGQRVLVVEAGRSWAALCRELGDDAPGPLGLRLPPDHERLASTPTWWFHQHGVERSRARTMVAVARHAGRLAEVVDLPLPDAYARMRAVPGLGPWTVNGVARTALGDPDAIIVADYWISHAVCSFFTGRPRGSDEEMLALVERWAGQRGRVERLVHLSGHRVQRFAAGRRTPRIAHL